MCRQYRIYSIGLVRSKHNPADELREIERIKVLAIVLETEIDGTPVEQWINRDIVQSDPNGKEAEVSY